MAEKEKRPYRTKVELSHPNSINPFFMLHLTQWEDNFPLYINPDEIVGIRSMPAYESVADGKTHSECTQLTVISGCHSRVTMRVNETPEEIFWRKDALDKRIAEREASPEVDA